MAQEFEGLYVKFGANTVEFDNSVKGMNSALSTLKKDLQTLNKNLKLDPGNVDLLAKKMQNFQQQVELGTKKVEELRKQQKALGDEKIGTSEWQKLESEISKTEAQMQIVERSIKGTQKQLDKFTPGTVQHTLQAISEDTKKLNKDLVLLDKELKLNPDSIDLLSDKFGMLVTIVEKNQKKIELLKKEQEALGDSELGSKEWQELENQINDAQNSIADARIEMQGVNKVIDETQKRLNQFTPGTVEHSLKSINDETQNLERNLRLLDKELQLNPDNVEDLDRKFNMLEKSAELSKKKIALLKQEQDKFDESDIDSEDWRQLESDIDDAKNALADTKIEMKNVESELKRVEEAAEKAAEEADKLAEELKSVTPGNIEHVNKKLDEMADKAQKTADKVGKIKDGFEKAGNAAKPFSAIAAGGLVASAKAAGDLQEQVAKTEAVFKSQSDEMDKFAESSLKNFNMAENTSRDLMNTYGAMGSGLGLTAEENAKLAKSLTGLTADTVAFNDVSTDRARTALKGIYTGETESLKELGVVMTQANLENYALNKGYGKTIKEMTEAEKVTLRYNYVMDAMSDAQGAAKREQDSFNGQLRYFKEQIIEIATRIGEQMMPVLEELLKGINDFVEKIANLDDKGFKNIAKALVAVAAVAPLLLGVGKILGVVQSALMGWAGALKAIKGTKFAAFLAKAFGTATTGPIIASILAVAGVILAIGIALKQIWDESESFRNSMKQIWANIKGSVQSSINSIVYTVKYLVSTNSDSVNKIKVLWEGFKKVVEFVATVIGRTVEFIAVAFQGLVAVFSGTLTKSESITKSGLSIIESAFKKFIITVVSAFKKTDWVGLGKSVMTMLMNGVKSLVSSFYNIYVSLMDKTFNLIRKIDWFGLGKTVLDFVIKGISSLASLLWNTAKKLFDTAFNTIKNINWDSLGQTLMRLIIQGISAIGSMIWNTLRGIFSSAKSNSEKSIDWRGIGLTIINMIVQGITVLMGVIWKTLRGALTEAWRNAKNIDWAGIGSAIINGITSRISAIGSKIWNTIRNALNNAKSWASNISWSSVGGSIVNGIVSGITGLAGKIRDKIVSAFNTAKSWTSGLWDNITSKRSFDMQFNGNVVPNMQRMAMPVMGNYYNPVIATSGHSINISVDARGDNADMIARRVERAIVRRIQS